MVDVGALTRRVTNIETPTIYLWLAAALLYSIGQVIPAVILLAGIFIEEWTRKRVLVPTGARVTPLFMLAILVETGTWIASLQALLRLGVSVEGILTATAINGVGFWVEHEIIKADTLGRSVQFFSARTLGLTLTESATGALVEAAWVAGGFLVILAGSAIFYLGSTGEHREGIVDVLVERGYSSSAVLG